MIIPDIKPIVSPATDSTGVYVAQLCDDLYQRTIVFAEIHPSSGNAALLEVIQSASTSTAVASTAGTVRYSLGAYVAGVPQSSTNPLMLNVSDRIYIKLTGNTPTAYIAVI